MSDQVAMNKLLTNFVSFSTAVSEKKIFKESAKNSILFAYSANNEPTKYYVTYVKWLYIFLYTKFGLDRSINKFVSAIYLFCLFIVTSAILDVGSGCHEQTLVYSTKGPSTPNLLPIGPVVSEEKINVYARTHGRTISSAGYIAS